MKKILFLRAARKKNLKASNAAWKSFIEVWEETYKFLNQ
jgi:hypothetical protein